MGEKDLYPKVTGSNPVPATSKIRELQAFARAPFCFCYPIANMVRDFW